ncbi:hypothetical protein [Acinetobacter sp. ANC 3791]|uniref:hypothetical protein n=1 Tax=Acinetobacter sp. ANC 3791 TaxID=2529836 RepID=UPI00103E19A9|nr:hypothetical protein [Acinetobacter sp. ANC 3791]
MSQFEEWFQLQSFYLNLRFIHGERLFIFDAQDGYVVQAVQIAWMTWQEQQKQIDAVQSVFAEWEESMSDFKEMDLYDKGYRVAMNGILEELRQALKGSESQVQEPQTCDHTMVEKTQFGDLHRTFECIFCDYKTTEAWVTTHE